MRNTIAEYLWGNTPPPPAELPEDLVFEIIKLLPLRNALQYSCVSKNFRSYITDPSFAREHALLSSESASAAPSSGRIIIFHCSAFQAMLFTVLNSPAASASINVAAEASIMASCNGVFLLRLKPSHYFVLNPLTGGNMFLGYNIPSQHASVGLAVDFPAADPSSSPSFKVVIAEHRGTVMRFTVAVPSGGEMVESAVEFNCTSVQFTCARAHDDVSLRPVYAHGRLHWLGAEADKILTFDVEKQRARIINGPIRKHKPHGFHKRVDKWFGLAKGSLHFVYVLPEEIVVHTHDHRKGKWRLAHRIPNMCEREKNNVLRDGVPVYFDGEQVFLHLRVMLDGGGVWMYNLKSREWTETGGKVRGWADWNQNFYGYIPTLANVCYGKDVETLLQECPPQHKGDLRLYSHFKQTFLGLHQLLR
ncbi:hypothetical protein ABFS83_14G280900 [Erythranthe nasuta]